MNTPHPSIPAKVLAFDVFGTVVDWHSGIAREVQALCPGVDGSEFALLRPGRQQPVKAVSSNFL